MSNVLPKMGNGAELKDPLNYKIVGAGSSPAAATHISHMGVGGYIELPTIDYRNDIPSAVDGTVYDGITTGRRKLGMVVYITNANKFYQLIPNINGVPTYTSADWAALNDYAKFVALDPMKGPVEDDDGVIWTGSGNPDDAWIELSIPQVPFGITGDGSIQKIVTLTQAAYDALASSGYANAITLYVIV